MYGVLGSLLAAAVLVAGCAGQPEVDSSGASARMPAAHPVVVRPPLEYLNLTHCTLYGFFSTADLSSIQGLLPPKFTASAYYPGPTDQTTKGGVSLDAFGCDRAEILGHGYENAGLAFTTFQITDEEGGGPNHFNSYLAEVFVDEPSGGLAADFKTLGLVAMAAHVDASAAGLMIETHDIEYHVEAIEPNYPGCTTFDSHYRFHFLGATGENHWLDPTAVGHISPGAYGPCMSSDFWCKGGALSRLTFAGQAGPNPFSVGDLWSTASFAMPFDATKGT
jgi:hypothetical protein